MIVWQRGHAIFQDKAHVDGVTRPPDAPLAVEESLHPLLERCPADIEGGEREATITHREVGALRPLLGDDEERLRLGRIVERVGAIAARRALSELLQLVVEQLHGHP